MAVKNYYLGAGNDGNFGALVDGVAQTAASRTDGWTVAKIASGNSCEFDAGTKQVSGSFTSQTTTPKPASFLTGTTANAFKTPAALTGTFAATTWAFSHSVRATTASSQAGRIRLRVFKSVNASGASATELTSATVVSNTSAALTTTADATVTTSWAPGTTITLNNEYLFFVIAWEITTASGSNSGDVVYRTGSTTVTSCFVTTDFTPTGGVDVITPTSNVTNTQSASGSVVRLRPIKPAGVTNTQSAGGSVRRLRPVTSAGITNTQSVSGAFAKNLPPVADYQGRWDASDPSSITVSSGYVTSWADKGSLGLAMLGGGTSDPGPTLDGTINGVAVPNFNGAVNMHTIHAQTIPNQTVFAVIKPTIAGQDAGIWGGDRYGSEIGLAGGIPRIVFTYSAEIVRADTALAAGTSHILAMVYDNVTAKLHVDGKEFSASYPNGFAGTDSTWSLIGQTWSGWFTGQVAEVIWFERTLSSIEVAAMESYLKTKWGVFPPKLATLTDTFDTTVDFTKWDSASGVTWDSVGKRAALACTGPGEPNESWLAPNYATPGHTYDFTGSYFMAKVVLPPATNGSEMDMNVIVAEPSWGYRLDIAAINGTLAAGAGISAYHRIAGAWAAVGTAVDYDPVAHAWWRIRESGGTIYYEVGPDGRTWNLLASEAAPFAITEVFCDFECYNQGSTNTGTGYIDNVNILPPISVPPAGITNTNQVSGGVRRLRRITPAGITNTQSASGTIRRLRPVVPTTTVTNTQSASGSLRARRAITPAGITNTQSASGSLGALRRITPAGITNTQSASGTVTKPAIFKPVSGAATNTNAVSGAVQKIAAPKLISGTATNTQSVAGAVSKPSTPRPIAPTTTVTNTQSVSGSVGKIAASKFISGTATNTNSVSGSLRILRKVAGVVTNTQSVAGAIGRLRPITAGAVTNTQSVSGAIRRLAKVTPAGITNTQSASGTVSRAAVLRQIAGTATNTQSVAGAITTRPVKVVLPATTSNTQTVSGSLRAARAIRPTTTLTNTQSVSGSLVTRRGVLPGTITNTQQITGTISAVRAIKPSTGITNTQTVSGSIRVGRGIRPTTQTTFTNNVSGSLRKLYVLPTGVTNTQTVSGSIRRTFKIVPTTILTYTNNVSGLIGRKTTVKPTTTIINMQAVSGGILRLRGIRPSGITWTNNVSGSVLRTRILVSVSRLHPGTIVTAHRGRTSLVGNTEGIQLTPANAEISVGDRGVIQMGESGGEV